jgi:hypothetical protein
MHRFATDMGAAGPSPPLAAQFMRDVAVDDEAAKGLLQVLNHDIPAVPVPHRAPASQGSRPCRARPTGSDPRDGQRGGVGGPRRSPAIQAPPSPGACV